jgi:hypothetical protein
VKDQEPNGHLECVESCRRQAVDARQLVRPPLPVLALSREAVADRQTIRSQVTHKAERPDEPAKIPAKIDDQMRAVLKSGQRPIQIPCEALAIDAWEERNPEVSNTWLNGIGAHARRFRHRRLRISFSWVRLWQDNRYFPCPSIGAFDGDLRIRAERERWQLRRGDRSTVRTK